MSSACHVIIFHYHAAMLCYHHAIIFVQTEVEAIHPLYVELFSYLDFWKQQQTQNADSLYVVSSSLFLDTVMRIALLAMLMWTLYARNARLRFLKFAQSH